MHPRVVVKDLTGKIVWVVDDTESIRTSVRAVLEARSHNVRTCASASEFLQQFVPGEAGCLIVDFQMPGLTGLELLKQLRVSGHTLPVIVVTGAGDATLAKRIVESGAIAMLPKPVDASHLVTLVEQALSTQR